MTRKVRVTVARGQKSKPNRHVGTGKARVTTSDLGRGRKVMPPRTRITVYDALNGAFDYTD